MRIKITVSYDGTDYCGWQVQPNGISVQSVLEEAIEKITGEKVKVTGSGRTDAGVHALGQVADFYTEKDNIPPENFAAALNTVLPDNVSVIKSERVADDFNSRKCAKKKTYRYLLYRSAVKLPLYERYAVQTDKNVDINKMREVSKVFIGTHDFKCFNASGGGAKTTVRTVYSIEIAEKGCMLSVSVTGNGFLYNMVRIMTGTLLKAGQGKLSAEDAGKMLLSGKRSDGGNTLPAKGLCLMKVEYD